MPGVGMIIVNETDMIPTFTESNLIQFRASEFRSSLGQLPFRHNGRYLCLDPRSVEE